MISGLLASVLCLGAAGSPPLTVEIEPTHPLYIFEAPGADAVSGAGQAVEILHAWRSLPESLRPYSAMRIRVAAPSFAGRQGRLHETLEGLLQTPVPLVVEIADGDPSHFYPLLPLGQLLERYTAIKGIHAAGLTFNEYYEFGEMDPVGAPAQVRWLMGAVETAAQYGRFIAIELGEVHWPRVMSNAWCADLYSTLRENAAYVVPLNSQRGPHNIARISALMGLWLEGAVNQWGVTASSKWYAEARFVEPGVFGITEKGTRMPPSLYRAFVLTGAMTGATVYLFDEEDDLWFGSRRHRWDEAIRPILEEVAGRGLIARKDIVQRKARVAYQLAPSRTAADFHENLVDIDGVLDRGNLIHGAYGMEKPGQIPELIPNTGRFYWVPILSPYASAETLGAFDEVGRPGALGGADYWAQMLQSYYRPDGEGTAFISRVGRGIFVLHTRENLYEEQTYRLPSVPAPVRSVRAQRTEEGVSLSWPFREEDFSYRVYRRVLPETEFSLVAQDLDDRKYLDVHASPDDTVAYAVTALTNEHEAYEGTVNFGDYLVMSTVESRIAEDVLMYPLSEEAMSAPIAEFGDARPRSQAWWPNTGALEGEERSAADVIAGRLEALGTAFEAEDLGGAIEVYAEDYEDAYGWTTPYLRQAYGLFFKRYSACRMHRQIRRWDFREFSKSIAPGPVKVLLYCRFAGIAETDSSGRFADVPVYFPRAATGEVWITFRQRDGLWKITETNPPLPDPREILGFTPTSSRAVSTEIVQR